MKRSFTELENSENDTICSDCDESIENQPEELFEKNDNDIFNDDVLEIIKKVKVNNSLTCNSPMEIPYYSSNLFQEVCFFCGLKEPPVSTNYVKDEFYFYCNDYELIVKKTKTKFLKKN